MSRTTARPVLKTALVVGVSGVVALTATACRPTLSGAAATVGSTRITDAQVALATTQGYLSNNPQVTQAEFQRAKLSLLVLTALDQHIADAEGISVSDQDVAAIRSTYETQAGGADKLATVALQQGGYGPAEFQRFLYRQALDNAILKPLIAATPPTDAYLMMQFATATAATDSSDVSLIVATDLASATSLYNQVKAAPDTFAAVAKASSKDPQSAAMGGDLGAAGRGQDNLPTDVEDAIYAGAVGDVLGPIPYSQTDQTTGTVNTIYLILKINALKAASFAAARAGLVSDAEQPDSAYAVMLLNSVELAAQKKYPISVNQRYGVWTPSNGTETGQVTDLTGDVLSSVPSLKPSASATGAATDGSGAGGAATGDGSTTGGAVATAAP